MTAEQQLLIEREVTRVIVQFFNHLDGGEFEKLIALFAPDGVWHRQGKVLTGPGAVRQALAERPAGVTTRHIVTNLLIDVAGPDAATARYYMTAFRHDADKKAEGPVPMELPFSVALYREKFVRTDDGWRIAELAGQVTFKR